VKISYCHNVDLYDINFDFYVIITTFITYFDVILFTKAFLVWRSYDRLSGCLTIKSLCVYDCVSHAVIGVWISSRAPASFYTLRALLFTRVKAPLELALSGEMRDSSGADGNTRTTHTHTHTHTQRERETHQRKRERRCV